MLENPAPYHAFVNHQHPSAQELQHTALVDPRWMEVFLSHVKDIDAYQEAKRRLGARGVKKDDGEEKPKGTPKPKPKAKGKSEGKGKEKSSSSSAAQEGE